MNPYSLLSIRIEPLTMLQCHTLRMVFRPCVGALEIVHDYGQLFLLDAKQPGGYRRGVDECVGPPCLPLCDILSPKVENGGEQDEGLFGSDGTPSFSAYTLMREFYIPYLWHECLCLSCSQKHDRLSWPRFTGSALGSHAVRPLVGGSAPNWTWLSLLW